MKFTIIMPTYNDGKSIEETLNTVVNQTYTNWELVIVDDGSTDNTKNIIQNFQKKHKSKNISYYYQENQDQLKAISNNIDKINGDYIFILHSDDLLANKDILEKAQKILEKNKCEALTADFININEVGDIIGKTTIPNYKRKEYIKALTLLWLGRNIYVDMAFFKNKVFKTKVKDSYLDWNTPYWLTFEKETCNMLDVKKANFSFIKYRMFEGNYINNVIGKLNVINGELRTAVQLMKYYDIPFFKIQYIFFRIFNKLGLLNYYRPFYLKKETKNKAKIIRFIISKRYNDEYKKYAFFNSLIAFYENYQKRTITIDNIDEKEFIYIGADMRKFNNAMINNKLSPIYKQIFREMNTGFNTIITSKKNYSNIQNICKFLCIYPFVNIIIKHDK